MDDFFKAVKAKKIGVHKDLCSDYNQACTSAAAFAGPDAALEALLEQALSET